MIFYEVIPLDTLFFRGDTPMEAGQTTCESLFPPPSSVIMGAFRTELMKQFNIPLNRTNGDKIAFTVEAVLVKKGKNLYAPWPANWYVELPKDEESYIGKKIIVSEKIDTTNHPLRIQSSEGDVSMFKENEKEYEAKSEEEKKYEAQNLSSCWVNTRLLTETLKGCSIKIDDILPSKDIYSNELRTGIGLDNNKNAEEGKLYSSSHIRLQEGISLVFCLSQEPSFEGKFIQESGIIQLGGEKRLCSYKKLKCDELPNMRQNYYSYIPVEATANNVKKIVASGKIKATSGWDLDKGFHKPTTSWIPAGAIFTEKV